MRRAAAYEAKYAERDAEGNPVRLTVPIMNVGVHPQNRCGVYTQGQRCKELLIEVMVDGFDMEEAVSNGVAVRERLSTRKAAPAAEAKGSGDRNTAPAADGQQTAPAAEYETFAAYNIKKSQEDKLLHGTYSETDIVSYASLAHSHLLNTSRAILMRLKWDVEFTDASMSACDSGGHLSSTALAVHTNGKEWKRFLEAGMTFKVLAAKMDIEEPAAAAVISSARNKCHARAMQDHEWTALRLLNGGVIVDNADIASQEVYRQYTEKARQGLGADAMDRPLVQHLIEFVHQLHGTPFVGELTMWAEKMINSNKRQATYKLYKVANQLPKTALFAKVAFIMKHYSTKPDEDKFVPDPNKSWSTVQESYLTQLEVLLRYLKQEGVRTALATALRQRFALPNAAPADEAKIERDVRLMDTQLITSIVEKFEEVALKTVWGMTTGTLQRELTGAARVLLEKYDVLDKLPPPPEGCEWLDFKCTAPAADMKAKAKPKGRPKGKPKTTQGAAQGTSQIPRSMEAALSDTAPVDAKSINVSLTRQTAPTALDDNEIYKLPWREWRRSEHFTNQGMLESLMAAGLVAARELHAKIDTVSLPIEIMRVNGKYKVVATSDIAKGELLIPPSISQKSKFFEKTHTPHATPVTVEYEMQTQPGRSRIIACTVAAPDARPPVVPDSNTTPADGPATTSESVTPAASVGDTAPADGTATTSESVTPAASVGDTTPAERQEVAESSAGEVATPTIPKFSKGDKLVEKIKGRRVWTIMDVNDKNLHCTRRR